MAVRFAKVKLTSIVLGSDAVHGAPPPVQAEEGIVKIGVDELVLAV